MVLELWDNCWRRSVARSVQSICKVLSGMGKRVQRKSLPGERRTLAADQGVNHKRIASARPVLFAIIHFHLNSLIIFVRMHQERLQSVLPTMIGLTESRRVQPD